MIFLLGIRAPLRVPLHHEAWRLNWRIFGASSLHKFPERGRWLLPCEATKASKCVEIQRIFFGWLNIPDSKRFSIRFSVLEIELIFTSGKFEIYRRPGYKKREQLNLGREIRSQRKTLKFPLKVNTGSSLTRRVGKAERKCLASLLPSLFFERHWKLCSGCKLYTTSYFGDLDVYSYFRLVSIVIVRCFLFSKCKYNFQCSWFKISISTK